MPDLRETQARLLRLRTARDEARSALRRGVFALRDPEEAASTLRAIFDGLMLQWLMEKEPETSFSVYRDRCERELLAYLLPAKSTRGRGKL